MTHGRRDRDIVVLGGARTPFGTFMGSLKDVSAIELGAIAARAALERSGVDPKDVDQVVFGNVLQTSKDAIYLRAHIGAQGRRAHRDARADASTGSAALACRPSSHGAQSLLLGEGDRRAGGRRART